MTGSGSPNAVVLGQQGDLAAQYYKIALIRRFEERLLELFASKELTGTTHTCIGQEAAIVAAASFLNSTDFVCAQHRSHGHFIAAGGDPRSLFLEMLGDVDGICNGIGGSQHLFTPNFLSNGILGGTPAVATGIALASKLRADGAVVVSFIGDGTLGEGITYESLNLASLWKLPLLIVVENNGYAQTTPIHLNLAGTIRGRMAAFGIACDEIESNDVTELTACFASAFAHVRSGLGPFCQIVDTYRLAPHSKGDDFRPKAEVERWRARDPLLVSGRALGTEAARIRGEADAAARAATTMPAVIHSLPLGELGQDDDLVPTNHDPVDGWRRSHDGEWFISHLRATFAEILKDRPESVLLGEDILDPSGGAFAVYKGLSTAFPQRVLTTPVSEAGIIAAANGLALQRMRPIVEIMFGDFSTLALDQLLNHATKFGRMYRKGAASPIIVRTPFGGYRGYGPTHSQSLEKLFLGIPGLVVTASDTIHDQALIWRRMLALSAPCLHVENKVQYASRLPSVHDGRLGPFHLTSSRSYFPTTRLTLDPAAGRADISIIAYGGMVSLAMQAAILLFGEDELLVDVVLPSQLAPVPFDDFATAVLNSRGVIVLEEGTERAGFGAEVIAGLACRGLLDGKKAARCAALDTVIPNNAVLERSVLPGIERLIDTARGLRLR